jgi:uncharacterized protein (TIGR01777 family)
MGITVLIAGGSGLIGHALIDEFFKKGYSVKLLGRNRSTIQNAESFVWDPSKNIIDLKAFENTDYIINLAGANVGEGKWTAERKKELLDSRIQSTTLLINSIAENNFPIKKFIQASAIGYYGLSDNDVDFMESDPPGKDFLAILTGQWEKAADRLNETKIPLLKLRIGVVLSNKGGALMAMAKPVRLFAGASLGNGKQIVPWIHIDDMVAIFVKGIEDPGFTGTYNAASPHPVSNKQLTKAIAKAIKRPFWPIGIPSFLLKIILGEQAQIVLKGNKISSKKLISSGFKFQYSNLQDAIVNLFKG